ncbi:hypothetical protein [Arthrobacter rhizosphaerae]|uniref:hypothetical protein n=1 Tax=Arthrobacter rhizosphaerae TaxID=2855490 RepID=UPI001FF40673|nr:hypothetical protein [Arthrobacter rhizosphaerae]
MIRKALTILLITTLAMLLGGCLGKSGGSDADLAAKYKAAAESIAHVDRAEVEYKTIAGMGRTGRIDIFADSSDHDIMMRVFEEALPAIVDAAEGDPEVSLPIQVVSMDGSKILGVQDLGISGVRTLNSYREFLGKK